MPDAALLSPPGISARWSQSAPSSPEFSVWDSPAPPRSLTPIHARNNGTHVDAPPVPITPKRSSVPTRARAFPLRATVAGRPAEENDHPAASSARSHPRRRASASARVPICILRSGGGGGAERASGV